MAASCSEAGGGTDDLDTVEQDPHKQEGATEAVQLPTGETEARGICVGPLVGRSGSERGNGREGTANQKQP